MRDSLAASRKERNMRPRPDRNHLGMVGDGDDLDLIYDFEKAFGVAIPGQESEELRTVGDLYDLVTRKIGARERSGNPCLSAMTFYLLRRHLSSMTGAPKLSPSSPCRRLMARQGIRRRWRELSARTNLDLPTLKVVGFPIVMFLIGASIAPSFMLGSFYPALAGLAAGITLYHCLPREIAYPTMAELTQATLAWNFGTIRRQHGSARPNEVWRAVTIILKESTGHRGEIDRQTRFFK